MIVTQFFLVIRFVLVYYFHPLGVVSFCLVAYGGNGHSGKRKRRGRAVPESTVCHINMHSAILVEPLWWVMVIRTIPGCGNCCSQIYCLSLTKSQLASKPLKRKILMMEASVEPNTCRWVLEILPSNPKIRFDGDFFYVVLPSRSFIPINRWTTQVSISVCSLPYLAL